MKTLYTCLLLCMFTTSAFAQNAFFEKAKQHRADIKPQNAAAKAGFKVQLIQENSIYSDLEVIQKYNYNLQGKQTLQDRYNLENDSTIFSYSRDLFIYNNENQLIKTEEYERKNDSTFLLTTYSDYSYDNNNVVEITKYRKFFMDTTFTVDNKVLYDYDNENRVIYEEIRRLNFSGQFETRNYETTEYYKNNLVGEIKTYTCTNDTTCKLSNQESFEYNSNDVLIKNIITDYDFNGNVEYKSETFYDYNKISKALSNVIVNELDTNDGQFKEYANYDLFHGPTRVLDSLIGTLKDIYSNDPPYTVIVNKLNYNTNITREEILFPSDYDFTYDLLYGELFKFQLNSFRIRFIDDNNADEELYEYTYSNFTSVAENENFAFTLSPNPTSNILNVQLKDGEANNALIFNSLGQIMLSQDISNSNFTIDTESLKPGVYFIKITGDNGFLSKRFVKL